MLLGVFLPNIFALDFHKDLKEQFDVKWQNTEDINIRNELKTTYKNLFENPLSIEDGLKIVNVRDAVFFNAARKCYNLLLAQHKYILKKINDCQKLEEIVVHKQRWKNIGDFLDCLEDFYSGRSLISGDCSWILESVDYNEEEYNKIINYKSENGDRETFMKDLTCEIMKQSEQVNIIYWRKLAQRRHIAESLIQEAKIKRKKTFIGSDNYDLKKQEHDERKKLFMYQEVIDKLGEKEDKLKELFKQSNELKKNFIKDQKIEYKHINKDLEKIKNKYETLINHENEELLKEDDENINREKTGFWDKFQQEDIQKNLKEKIETIEKSEYEQESKKCENLEKFGHKLGLEIKEKSEKESGKSEIKRAVDQMIKPKIEELLVNIDKHFENIEEVKKSFAEKIEEKKGKQPEKLVEERDKAVSGRFKIQKFDMNKFSIKKHAMSKIEMFTFKTFQKKHPYFLGMATIEAFFLFFQFLCFVVGRYVDSNKKQIIEKAKTGSWLARCLQILANLDITNTKHCALWMSAEGILLLGVLLGAWFGDKPLAADVINKKFEVK